VVPSLIGRLQGVAHLALAGEGQPAGGDRRPREVAAQPLHFLSLIGTGRYARVQGEAVGVRPRRQLELVGEVGEEGLDLGRGHFPWVPVAVEPDERPDPIDVGFLSL